MLQIKRYLEKMLVKMLTPVPTPEGDACLALVAGEQAAPDGGAWLTEENGCKGCIREGTWT